jgi:glycosyltransferase involved in cell wall biosynthesis
MYANVTLANSGWIAARIRALHGIEAETLHPPAPGAFPAVPWEARRPGFVCVGRLSPEKRVEDAVAILAEVRRVHPEVELHVVGSPDQAAYGRRVRALVAAHGGWVFLHENLPRPALTDLLSRQRWGIHAMPDEHFGIAVAEMVRAGCIPFVPTTGGPREIVGDEPALLFDSPADAVRRITAVLGDERLQAELRRRLAARAPLFTPERFAARLRALVAQVAGSAAASRRNSAFSRSSSS